MTTTTDPREVAAGLSEPQKRLILSIDDRAYSCLGYHPKVLSTLFRKGLIGNIYAAGHRFFSLTDAGLAVRAILEENHG